MAEKTLPPSYSDDKAGGASSSVVSRMSALRMIPCIDKDRKTAYISPKCVSYIQEGKPGDHSVITARATYTATQLNYKIANTSFEEIHAVYVPTFVILPSDLFVTDGGKTKSLRNAVFSKPNGKTPWLRVLINPDAVVGIMADRQDSQRSVLYMAFETGEITHDTEVGILMPMEEVRQTIDLALSRAV